MVSTLVVTLRFSNSKYRDQNCPEDITRKEHKNIPYKPHSIHPDSQSGYTKGSVYQFVIHSGRSPLGCKSIGFPVGFMVGWFSSKLYFLTGFPVGYRRGPESHWFIILYFIHGRVIGLGGWVFNSTLIWLFSSFDFTKLGLV